MRRPDRIKNLNIPAVIETLGLKPGMEIADIGAGLGVFAFPMAGAVGGTGRIYAADIDGEMISYLRGEAARRGLRNITAVKVRPDGVDPFYRGRRFDIIFLSIVYHHLRERENFFRELKPSLKDGGRVCIISSGGGMSFDAGSFGDFSGTLRKFSRGRGRHPIARAMGEDVWDFIDGWDGGAAPARVRDAVLRGLNALLSSRTLLFELEKFSGRRMLGRLPPDDRLLFKWLYVRLDAWGGFDPEIPLDAVQLEALQRFNRILIVRALGLARDYSWEAYRKDPTIGRNPIVSSMKVSGYRLAKEHDILKPRFLFLEFVPAEIRGR